MKKNTAAKKEKVDHRVEREYEEWVEFTCPKRGKVRQLVKVRRYKTLTEEGEKHLLSPSEVLDNLDKKDDGLHIYGPNTENE